MSNSTPSTSMSSKRYILNKVSYAIPILHSALYPSSTVLGVFLSSSSSSSSSSLEEDEVIVDGVIPLLHLYTSLSAMIEVALSLVDEYAKKEGKRIVGLYIAHANTTTNTEQSQLGRVVERILDGIREKFNGTFALVIDNDKLSSGQPAYIPYLSSNSNSSSSKPLISNDPSKLPEPFFISPSTPSSTIPSDTLNLIREKKVHRLLIDFDDHLENSTLDFLENKSAVQAIKQYLS